MTIRSATENDIHDWSAMRTALWPDADDRHIGEIKAYFSGQSIDIVDVYVVDINFQLIGFLELNIRTFAEGSRKSQVPYIEAWYIKPEFQGKGYGSQLIRQAEKWAISKGYNELASDTEVYNKKSILMHKHLGFSETEHVVCFIKKLNKG